MPVLPSGPAAPVPEQRLHWLLRRWIGAVRRRLRVLFAGLSCGSSEEGGWSIPHRRRLLLQLLHRMLLLPVLYCPGSPGVHASQRVPWRTLHFSAHNPSTGAPGHEGRAAVCATANDWQSATCLPATATSRAGTTAEQHAATAASVPYPAALHLNV